MNKNLLKGTNTTNNGAVNNAADNMLAFEAFFNGEVDILAKLQAGKYAGAITKIEDVVKETTQYTKLTIALADRDISYIVFNKESFVLEYNLNNGTQYKNIAELLNKDINIYVAYTSETDTYGTKSISPQLTLGSHQVVFNGLILDAATQSFVISFKIGDETYYDIRLYTKEKEDKIKTTFRFLGRSLGFTETTSFGSFNTKIGTEITVNVVKVDGYKKLFLNYSQPQSTVSESDNATDAEIPQYNY